MEKLVFKVSSDMKNSLSYILDYKELFPVIKLVSLTLFMFWVKLSIIIDLQ